MVNKSCYNVEIPSLYGFKMKKNISVFFIIFTSVYLLFAQKYSTLNLFKYFEYDYFNLNQNWFSFWRGISIEDFPFLNSYALIDLTYIRNQIYNNNGGPVSLLYSVLGSFAFGPLILVTVISLHLLSIKKIAEYLKVCWVSTLAIYILFIPIVDLFYTKMFTSEIATWFALSFLSWGYLYILKGRYFFASFLLLLTVLTRSEYIVISSLLILQNFRKDRRSLPLFFGGVLLMFYRNYLWTGEFPSFGDGYGRLHDALISYNEMSLLWSPFELFARVWFHLKSLLIFDPSVKVFSFTREGHLYLGTPLASLLFYSWIPVLYFKKIRTMFHDYRYELSFCGIQFLAISIVSESFFLRYALSYLFLFWLFVSLRLSDLSRKSKGLLIVGQLLAIVFYSITFKPIIFENEALRSESLFAKLKEGHFTEKPWGAQIKNSLNCEKNEMSDRLVKGLSLVDGHCFVDKRWVSISKSDESSCSYKVRFQSPTLCSKISFSNNNGQKGKLVQLDANSCEYEGLFRKSVVISEFYFPEDGANELAEISFSCL